MKHIIICGISLMFVSALQAQTNIFKDSAFSQRQSNRYFFNHKNQLQQKYNPLASHVYLEKVKPSDPSVLHLPQPKLVFTGNVNHSDIYQSSPDNMFIIKPDSTILFNMPVADID